MRQVTGSNNSASDKKVSIQRSLDGHSFSLSVPEGVTSADRGFEVEILSEYTMLVPSELFVADDDTARALFEMNGMPLSGEQGVLRSAPSTDIVALMALPAYICEELRAKCGKHANFTTPLLSVPALTQYTVWLCRRGDLLYIKVYGTTLELAEVVTFVEDAEIEYLVERLATLFPLRDFTLQLAGDERRAMQKILSKRFKTIVLCE